jgi:hypothetical protein
VGKTAVTHEAWVRDHRLAYPMRNVVPAGSKTGEAVERKQQLTGTNRLVPASTPALAAWLGAQDGETLAPSRWTWKRDVWTIPAHRVQD